MSSWIIVSFSHGPGPSTSSWVLVSHYHGSAPSSVSCISMVQPLPRSHVPDPWFLGYKFLLILLVPCFSHPCCPNLSSTLQSMSFILINPGPFKILHFYPQLFKSRCPLIIKFKLVLLILRFFQIRFLFALFIDLFTLSQVVLMQ